MSSSVEGIRAILLPGLDGSAELRAEFTAALAPEFATTILAYPNHAHDGPPLDYGGLIDWVRARLPADEPFVLIGESFAGPIAISIAAEKPPGLVGLVLAATFARTPRPVLARIGFIARWLPLHRLPLALTMHLLMGGWSTRDWRRRLDAALARVSPQVLQRRLLAVAHVDVRPLIADIACPVVHLCAGRDRIVPPPSAAAICDRSRNAIRIDIDGPHMLLQARPLECAAAIKRAHAGNSARAR